MKPPPPRLVESSHTSPPLSTDTRSMVGPPGMPNESVRFILSGSTNSSVTSPAFALAHDPARRARHRERLDLSQGRFASQGLAGRGQHFSDLGVHLRAAGGEVGSDSERRNQGQRNHSWHLHGHVLLTVSLDGERPDPNR